MQTYIYSLSDPRTSEVRYIGKSNRPKNRFNGHLNDKTDCRKARWIRMLKRNGVDPVLDIIDTVDVSEWEFWERHYISLFKSWGFDLTNLKEGGAGAIGKPTSEETKEKQRQAKLGSTLSDSTKEKLRKINLGKKQPLSAIAKTVAANIGRIPTDECKNKIRQKLKGRKRDSEAVAKMAKTNYRAVLQYHLNGNFVAEHQSVKAAKDLISPNNNGLSSHIKGDRPTWKGFKWKYKE